MKSFKAGVKIYSYDWFWKYRLNYTQAAAMLKDQGFDFVIAQNEYIPSMNTAVVAEVPPEHMDAFKSYNDLSFVKALQAEGIEYYASALMFFNPDEMERYGNIPVDMYGNRAVKEDWYIGACPSCDAYLDYKTKQIVNCARKLNPDGIFLGFMRFPGFWETWLPGTDERIWNEFCFCDTCMEKFSRERQITLPDIKEKGLWIRDHVYEEFADWKSDIILSIAQKVKDAARNYSPNIKLILNTLPFDHKNFGDNGSKIFGQNLEKLSRAIDIFEIMGYHQILNRSEIWVADVGREFKDRLPDREVVCTVQVAPAYLDGMHADKGRKETIDLNAVEMEIKKIREFVDGVVVYAWADFLEQKFAGDERIINYIRGIKK